MSLPQSMPVADGDLSWSTLRRMLGLIAEHRRLMSIYVLVILAETAAGVAIPLLFGKIVDDGIVAQDRQVVIVFALLIALTGSLQALLQYLTKRCANAMCENILFTLRVALFRHTTRLPLAFFSRSHTGALTARLGSELVEAQSFFTGTMATAISSVSALLLTLAAMATLSWQVTLVALPMIPVCLLASKAVGRRLQKLSREALVTGSALSSMTTERASIGGAQLAALYSNTADSTASYARRAHRVRAAFFRKHLVATIVSLVLGLVAACSVAAVYLVGGLLAISGELQAGTVVALAMLVVKVYEPLTNLTQVRVASMTSVVAFERVFELLDLQPLVLDAPDAVAATDVRGKIEFRNVTFAYPAPARVSLPSLENRVEPLSDIAGDPVLREVSFVAEPGQTIAFVGPSGAGKSTLSYLVNRLYDPSSGSVLLDDVDLRSLTVDSVRNHVGVVSQDPHMFHDTLRANLALGDLSADDATLIAAMRAARVEHVLDLLPDGLDTIVGERGFRLSGGEKQRLAIARLLIKDPAVVVLDEATAHLDAGNETAITETLSQALAGRTVLVIAHRLSTIRRADRICVLDGGRLVAFGTHRSLLSAGGLYAQFVATQSLAPTG